MKKVLVTGANGFLGTELVKELVSRNINVIAVDKAFKNEVFKYPIVECINIEDVPFEILEMKMKDSGIDCFIHLAWRGTSGLLRSDYGVQLANVKLTCDYVTLCSRINCPRFVYASSINEMETYEYLQMDSILPSGGYIYGTGKLAAHFMGETVAKLNDIEFIPVIITNIYGAGEKSVRLINSSIRKLLKGEHCSFTAGEQTYDFIYLTDAIRSIVEVAEKGNAYTRYYIGSGNPRPLRDFLIEMRDIVSPEAELGLGDLPFNGVNIDYSQFKLKKVEEDTGYRNRVSFKDGIRLLCESIKDEEI